MKKAFSRAFPIYPECLNCNYTNGTEVFCPDVGMGYADCGIAGSTTCEVPKNKVTEKANCPKKTEAEAYSWCPDIMGDPTCSDANPTDSFQCDEGQPVASSTFGWAKCPRKATPQEKDPECSGCLSQHKNAYVRKVEGCYQCFKDGTTNKAGQALKWCSDAGTDEQGCAPAASTTDCKTGADLFEATNLSTCPNDMSKKYNTTGTPGFVPEANYGYCADLMGEPWCQKDPTASFQCDVGPVVTGSTSAKCPDIVHESMWDPATLLKKETECSKGPSKMEDVTCDDIQEKIKTWTGAACMKTELAARFATTCCDPVKKNTTSTGGVANTVSHTVLAAAGLAAFLV
jgi:hypothetical protein